MQNMFKNITISIKSLIILVINIIKSLICCLIFFLRIEKFFFFITKYLIKVDFFDQKLKTNILLKFFFYIRNIFENFNRFLKINILQNVLTSKDHINQDKVFEPKTFFLFLGQTSYFKNENKFFVKKKKKNFISNFNIILLNDIVFDLEIHEILFFENVSDFFENAYNDSFLLNSTLYNYSMFQNRLLSNETILFDNFFFDIPFKDVKKQELLFYQYFVFFYSHLYINSEYNFQIIHSRDNMSFFTFFSIYYYDYFRIHHQNFQLFNPIYLLDDFRGFNTILQLNNNILTQNIEHYMLNLQKLIFEETHIFYNSKINYLNYKYISLFFFTLFKFNQIESINAVSLFEQSSLMFSRNYLNFFFRDFSDKYKYKYSLFFLFGTFILISFFNVYELIMLSFILFCFILIIVINRFFILFETKLFGYTSNNSNKIFYHKLYLSDYTITQYDDIYYYQQKYTMQRDSESRKLSNLISELELSGDSEDTLFNFNPANILNNNISELLFLNFYEILYDFEAKEGWRDVYQDELEIAELDRIEYYHGYPFEVFISHITRKNLAKNLQAAVNLQDFIELHDGLENILDQADDPESFYDFSSDSELDMVENTLNDLSEYSEDFEMDLTLMHFYSIWSDFFSVNDGRKTYNEGDIDLLLNSDIPDLDTESIEEEFFDPEDNTVTNNTEFFQNIQTNIQHKIFQTIYLELVQEKDFLIKYYNLHFLLKKQKLQSNDIIKLQKLLQQGNIPNWILNMNNFYKEVKYRVYQWYNQLYATKKVYNDFMLAMLNLEHFYGDSHVYFIKEKSYPQLPLINTVIFIKNVSPRLFLLRDDILYDYDYEYYSREFLSSSFAYTNILSNDMLTSNFKDDQSLIDILESVNFSQLVALAETDSLPVQLDFFHHNMHVVTNMLNTLNSNLYLLYCNNLNLNDFVLHNQILIFQHYLEYSIMKFDQQNDIKTKLFILFDLFKYAKFNTIYDLEFFFYNYILKFFKINYVVSSPLLVLNLVNYYINKYNIYTIKLPSNLFELNKFLNHFQQLEILIGLENFDSNTFIENIPMFYEPFYNSVLNSFDKEFLEYEELDFFFLQEFYTNEKYQTQFFYNHIMYAETFLYDEDEVVDGDITKLPPYIPYTFLNNINLVTEFSIPTTMQQKYLYSDYIFTTLYSEVVDDSFDFEGIFL